MVAWDLMGRPNQDKFTACDAVASAMESLDVRDGSLSPAVMDRAVELLRAVDSDWCVKALESAIAYASFWWVDV